MDKKISQKIQTKLDYFATTLSEILQRSLVAPDKALRWTFIANPSAGGFTINRRWKKHQNALHTVLEKVQVNSIRKNAGPSKYSKTVDTGGFGLITTSGPGHAASISKILLEEMSGENGAFYLFITAGGDGTSLEVLQVLYHASPALRSRFAVLRLPLGTGNDGADAWEMEDALGLVINPTRIEGSRGLKLSTVSGKTWPGGEPFLAFNILSVGLDAFVTHMTNKMKGKLPGDSYKLWVDIATLFYDVVYKVDFMEVKGFDENHKEIITFKEKLLLCAMGVSGHRSYGSHKMILPDDRNVCAVKQMPIFRKVLLKDQFTRGAHADKKEAVLFNGNRIEISGSYPILAQMDGETVRLEKTDFPIIIELTEPVIPLLKYP